MTDEKDLERPSEEAGGAAAASADGPEDVDGLRKRLDEEKEKSQGYLQSWQRAAADYQNLKKRTEEERKETARFANASLVINLLPLVDDLERALVAEQYQRVFGVELKESAANLVLGV